MATATPTAGTGPVKEGSAGSARGPARKPGRTFRPRTLVLTAVAWLLAALFLAPYLEMIVTALRPADELRDRTYLPDKLDWANFVDVWRESSLGDNLQVTLLVAGGLQDMYSFLSEYFSTVVLAPHTTRCRVAQAE